MAIVYKITNTTTNQIYFGWTIKDLQIRWKRHWYKAAIKTDYLHLSMKKYGKDAFMIESVFETDDNEIAKQKEIELIALFQTNISRFPDGNGFNMTDGGEGTIGYVFTQKHKDSLSIALKGKPKSENHRKSIQTAKIGELNPRYGATWSDEEKQLRRELWSGPNNPNYGKFGANHHSYGKKLSQDHIDKIKASNEKRQVKINQIDKHTLEILRTFPSMAEAARFVNVGKGKIYDCCKGTAKTSKGFIWKYA